MPLVGIKPLIGRPFVHGIWDCYAIVRDWYKLERTLELPDFDRTDGWWTRGENLYMKQYAAAGFVACRGELQAGDVIIMQVQANEPNHAGVYLGDALMLHHLYGQLSKRETGLLDKSVQIAFGYGKMMLMTESDLPESYKTF